MTEAEWFACDDPKPMMRLLRESASDRKWRLFGCASCRHIWHLLAGGPSRAAVEVAELFADGAAGEEELRAAYRAAWEVFQQLDAGVQDAEADGVADSGRDRSTAAEAAAQVVMRRSGPPLKSHLFPAGITASRAAGYSVRPVWEQDVQGRHRRTAAFVEREKAEQHWQASILRDIFGNPFRPVSFSPDWRTSTAVALAQQMYDSRDYSAMPILADALQDAGCDNADVLDHCRGPGPHVRGCWVVDLVLGKE
jgi:hypothetical protein